MRRAISQFSFSKSRKKQSKPGFRSPSSTTGMVRAIRAIEGSSGSVGIHQQMPESIESSGQPRSSSIVSPIVMSFRRFR